MSLANFSLPFQVATPSPYLFTNNIPAQTPANNLRLNAVLPSSPSLFSEQRQYHNQPYIPPAAYQRQHQNHHVQQQEQQQRRNTYYKPEQQPQPQYRTQNIQQDYITSPDTRYNDYGEDFRRTQPRQQSAKNIPQAQMRPPPSLDVDRHDSRVANHDAPRPSKTEDPFPEQPDG